MREFELNVETDPGAGIARLRLADGAGRHLAGRQVKLADHSPFLWEGIFDTREHVDRYAESLRLPGADRPASAAELLERIGVFLGESVLGPEIMNHLVPGVSARVSLQRDAHVALQRSKRCR